MFKVLLLCDYSREPERRLLKGLSDFAKTKGGWSYFTIPPTLYMNPKRKDEILERALNTGVDAVFGRWEGITREMAESLGIPVVLRTVNQDYPDFPMLSGKYLDIGKLGAEFFLKQHYTSYAFWGYRNLIWSAARRDGFMQPVQQKGLSVSVLESELGKIDEKEILQWLRSLPKPVGLMAANDVLAQKAAELCAEANIRVPQEVAILGVDNDEFICNISYPSLSSIHLDFEKQGRELGQAIWQMSKQGKTWPARIKVEPLKIIERNSTLRHNIKDPYVKRIVNYIDQYFDTPFTLEELTRDIPLSRRAIELRFKKEMAPETMLSYLTGLRIKRMCELLCETRLPITEVAERSGFDDVVNVSRTFKRYTGLTPLKYRNSMLARPSNDPHADNEEN